MNIHITKIDCEKIVNESLQGGVRIPNLKSLSQRNAYLFMTD